ncbi:MAG: amidohydrolase family protein, partial [Sphaerochaetaceae bacterium]|nr:amidohydrolase family protein [Sphaerochaetaceae bacterium]
MKTVIKNVKVVDGGKILDNGSIVFEDGKILEVCSDKNLVSENVIDGRGLYASSGFVDIHTHGAGGADFMDGTKEAFETACLTHLAHGTTTIIPTTLSGSAEELNRSIQAYWDCKASLSERMSIPGIHLEGPYFAMKQKGGQDPKYVRNPNPEEYKQIIGSSKGAIIRWSIAPELPGAYEMGDYLLAHGIIPT